MKKNEDDQVVRELRAFHAPDDIIEDALLEASPVIEIWPDNAIAFDLFLRLTSQWNMLPTLDRLIRTGLKYESVEALMRIEKIKNRADVFVDIQTMEFAALSVFNGERA